LERQISASRPLSDRGHDIGNITLAGTYLLGIVNPGGSFDNVIVLVVSAIIMAAVVYLAVRGIRPSIEVQTAIIIFEYAVIILFVLLALKREIIDAVPGTTAPSLNAFLPSTSSSGWTGIASAAVICGFLYAGWEAPLTLGEESKNARVNPGRAALLGVGFLTIWYAVLIIVFQGLVSPADIAKHGTDILGYAGSLLLPDPWGRLLSLAVLSAVFATTQMQLTESSRVTFAMAREKLLPPALAKLNHAFRTPWVAAIVLGAIPPLALIPYLYVQSATKAIGYIISADGMLYLAMYFVIAVSCVWYYRRLLGKSPRDLLLSGILPLIGGLSMLGLFIYGLTTQVPEVSVVTGVLVVLCLVWGVVAKATIRTGYFTDARNVHEVED
jgi:amino acid transporter